MRIRRLIGSLLALALAGSNALASSPGTTTGELLKIPLSARAIGMGEAYTALSDDSSALWWNPAGLAIMEQKEASFMHTSLIESVHNENFRYASPGDNYSMGTSLSYLGYGTIAGYDANDQPIGDQTAYALDLTGGLAHQFADRFFAGMTVSWLHEALANDSANTPAFNLGALYGLDHHWWDGNYTMGASVQNLGPGLKFVSERDPLPRVIKFGFAGTDIKKKPLNLTFDVSVPNDNVAYINMGGEYWFKNVVAFRLGYAGSNDEGKGLRVGMGLKYSGIVFDYAYGGFGDFGATQRLELSFRFGEKVHQMNKDERAILKEAHKARTNGDYVQSILAFNELLESNPNDDRVLHMMIDTHEAWLKKDIGANVVQTAPEIPSAEQAALNTLVPGQAYSPSNVAQVNYDNDPLGLSSLPDVTTLEAYTASLPRTSGTKVAVNTPTPTSPSMSDIAAPTPAAAAGGPALSPSDIYGN